MAKVNDYSNIHVDNDEFKEYTGIDLIEKLGAENVSPFFYRVQTRLNTYIDSVFYRNVDALYPTFTEYQKFHYKMALIEQSLYVFRNGDISVDSGYDTEKGVIIGNGELERLTISREATKHLILCGLWNTHIKTPEGFFSGGWFDFYD